MVNVSYDFGDSDNSLVVQTLELLSNDFGDSLMTQVTGHSLTSKYDNSLTTLM